MVNTQSSPDRRQEKKAQSRERILHEAAAIIRAEGAERVSVHSVMARAGMTVGGFYAHFPTKDALLAAAVTRMFDERYASYLAHLDERPAEDMLRRLVDNYLSLRHRDTAERGCPIPPLAGEVGRLADPVRAAFVAGMEQLSQGVERLLEVLGRPEPAALASSILAEMAGAISLARVQPDRAKAEAMLTASRRRVLERIGL